MYLTFYHFFIVVFDCGTLSPPLNGHVTFSGTTTGSMAAYSCDPGYSLQGGNDRQRCVNEIGWDGIPPKCQRKRQNCAYHTVQTY